MIENSKIDEVIRVAYQQSEYWLSHPRIPILLDKNQSELDELLIDNNSYFACLITAYNPSANRRTLQINAENQQKLINEFEALNLRYFTGVSIDPKGEWPEEEQLLVLDCDMELGKKLAKQFGQNAFLYIESAQLTELVWLNVRL